MKDARYIAVGFGAIGLFIGLIAGFSTAELTTTLLALIFALAGGSVIALMNKLDERARMLAGIALCSFGLVGSLALLGAMTARINGLLALSNEPAILSASQSPLRSDGASIGGECLQRIATGAINITPFCPMIDIGSGPVPGD